MNIAEFYDKISSKYEELITSPQVNAQLTSNLKNVFSKYKIFNGTILDVGCGPGNLKSVLGNEFIYTGIDISNEMLLKAKEKGYETIYGKIEELLSKIPSKSFDYIVSLSALLFVKDINSVFIEFDRISKKGWIATLADITPNYSKYFPIDEPIYNHSKIDLSGFKEDFYLPPWVSLTTGDKIRERMIFKRFFS